MRVLSSLALLSAVVQGEWTEDMGAELRMLSENATDNSTAGGDNSTAGGDNSTVTAPNSTAPGQVDNGNDNSTVQVNPIVVQPNTTTTTTTTATTKVGNTTTTTTTTVAGTTDIITQIGFVIPDISAKIKAASDDVKAAFADGTAAAAIKAVCDATDWNGCAAASSAAVTIGNGNTADTIAQSRRRLAGHTALNKVSSEVISVAPTASANSVKSALTTATSGSGASAFQTTLVAAIVNVVNRQAAALNMSNITTAAVTGFVASAPAPTAPAASSAASVSALFSFAFASVAAALFMF